MVGSWGARLQEVGVVGKNILGRWAGFQIMGCIEV
jgi:hypothetical protein